MDFPTSPLPIRYGRAHNFVVGPASVASTVTGFVAGFTSLLWVQGHWNGAAVVALCAATVAGLAWYTRSDPREQTVTLVAGGLAAAIMPGANCLHFLQEPMLALPFAGALLVAAVGVGLHRLRRSVTPTDTAAPLREQFPPNTV